MCQLRNSASAGSFPWRCFEEDSDSLELKDQKKILVWVKNGRAGEGKNTNKQIQQKQQEPTFAVLWKYYEEETS